MAQHMHAVCVDQGDFDLVAAPKPGGEFQAASFPPTMTIRGARTRLGVFDMRAT